MKGLPLLSIIIYDRARGFELQGGAFQYKTWLGRAFAKRHTHLLDYLLIVEWLGTGHLRKFAKVENFNIPILIASDQCCIL